MKMVDKLWQSPPRNSEKQGQRWEGQHQSLGGVKGLTHGSKKDVVFISERNPSCVTGLFTSLWNFWDLVEPLREMAHTG